MSGFVSRLHLGNLFNHAGQAGPRRFLIIGAVGVFVLGTIVCVSLGGSNPSVGSRTARMPTIDPLPGGLHSNPQQDKLALETNRELADRAAEQGVSFTPPIAASQPASIKPPATAVATVPAPIAAPAFHVVAASAPPVAAPLPFMKVAATTQTGATDPREDQAYADAVNRLLRGWNGRTPQTEVILQPSTVQEGDARGGAAGQPGGDGAVRPASLASGLGGVTAGHIIMPAGRGVYAHTVLAVDSDSGGSIVLQADSGPLAGDRMIGNFGRAGSNSGAPADRLIVRVNSIEHRGQTIAVDAIVTAPETMETSVASSVDEHYLARFLLPAAAAFIQGLGQALATTSNTVGVLSPLGGASYATHLNFNQQLGVGAGVAAAQVGNTLNQAAPKTSTVRLDANANVGVMFLAPVIDNRGP
jgi:intracellular multiplication protein IcmE